MIKFLKQLWRDRRGNALVIAGASLPLIMGSAGLASDTIQWSLWKRQLQRIADSAAEAGVYAKVSGNSVGTCSSIASATYSAPIANDIRQNNHLPQVPTCTVTNPPPSGSYSADNMAVKVDLSMQRQLSFSGMFMSAAPTITATATATIVPSGQYCVVSLENTSATGITATGNADVNLGCGMITNSTSLTAAVATGSSDVIASPIAAVGGISASNNWGTGTVLQPFTIAQQDPFASVNAPSSGSFPSGNCPNLTVNSNQTKTTWTAGSDYKAMGTNMYCFGDITLKGTVVFPSNSVIVLDGGSLNSNAQANVTCSGCTFVLTNRNSSSTATIGTVDLNGGATWNLTAPGTAATGDALTYKGMVIYQDRRAQDASNITNKINGNSSSFFQGAFYFPSQQVTFNGTAGMSTNCMQLVSRRVLYSGNMHISNSCPTNSGASSFTGKKVRLVA